MNTFAHHLLAPHLRRRLDQAAVVTTTWLVSICATVLAPGSASAQAHTVSESGYTLRASTVAAGILPEAMRQQYGIEADPRKAMLNVMVSAATNASGPNARAEVQVQVRNLYGVKTAVDVREMVENGQVSYLGVYDFLPREVLDFSIVARPVGTPHVLHLEFRDRLVARP